MISETESIYLGIPAYGNQIHQDQLNAILHASKHYPVKMKISSYSGTAYNCNLLYSNALNLRREGITHFCMLHSDVVPENGWLDQMMELMKKHEADILSAIIPIKYNKGLTSTAFEMNREPFNAWRPKRLTLHEAFHDYPPTFTAENIILNTGLMVVDLRKPFAEKLFFDYDDRILKEGDVFKPVSMPEDWSFSRLAKAQGAKLFATREVKLVHVGSMHFSNHSAWGTEKTDTAE